MQLDGSEHPEALSPGTAVEVRDHFCATWCHGFECAASTDAGYLILRVSDHYVLPVTFAERDIRRAS